MYLVTNSKVEGKPVTFPKHNTTACFPFKTVLILYLFLTTLSVQRAKSIQSYSPELQCMIFFLFSKRFGNILCEWRCSATQWEYEVWMRWVCLRINLVPQKLSFFILIRNSQSQHLFQHSKMSNREYKCMIIITIPEMIRMTLWSRY